MKFVLFLLPTESLESETLKTFQAAGTVEMMQPKPLMYGSWKSGQGKGGLGRLCCTGPGAGLLHSPRALSNPHTWYALLSLEIGSLSTEKVKNKNKKIKRNLALWLWKEIVRLYPGCKGLYSQNWVLKGRTVFCSLFYFQGAARSLPHIRLLVYICWKNERMEYKI